ncbi:MAG: hypothetical protein ACK2T6_08745 [Anaerolineae bacterium]
MLDRLADWLDRQPSSRRRLYSLLIAIILLTLPCYAAGILLLVLSDAEPSPAVPTVEPLPTAMTPIVGTADPDQMAPTPVQRQVTSTPTEDAAGTPTPTPRPVLPEITTIPTLLAATATDTALPTALPVPSATGPPTDQPPDQPTPTRETGLPVITQPVVLPPPLLTRSP